MVICKWLAFICFVKKIQTLQWAECIPVDKKLGGKKPEIITTKMIENSEKRSEIDIAASGKPHPRLKRC